MLAPITKVEFSVGSFKVTPEMRVLMDKVLDSGRISYGPLCKEFEMRFAQMHNTPFAVLSNSAHQPCKSPCKH